MRLVHSRPARPPGPLVSRRLRAVLAALLVSLLIAGTLASAARAADRVYWTNAGNNTISFARLDGTGGGGELPITGATPSSPRGVAIDAAAGRIYWANFGNSISFARLDGTGGGGQLPLTGATLDFPRGLAIDPPAGLVYWANANNNTLSFARLDGTGGGGQLPLTGASPSGPTFDALLEAPIPAGSPAITGTPAVGSALSCSQGAWAPDLLGSFLYRAPQGFSYQWSLGSSDLSGATSSLYTAAASGSYACRVTAQNQAGSASQTSAPVAVAAGPSQQNPAATSKDPKCTHLRKKLQRQRQRLQRPGSEAKRGLIKRNIEDTRKRLRRLGC